MGMGMDITHNQVVAGSIPAGPTSHFRLGEVWE